MLFTPPSKHTFILKHRFFSSLIGLTLCITLSQCSSSGTSPSIYGPINSDAYTLAVSGASADDTCTITGSGGRALGLGSPSSITYHMGLERAAIVRCGDLAALFSIEDDTVTLSDDSTTLAELLESTSLTHGAALMASVMQDLQTNASSLSLSFPPDLALSIDVSDIVKTTLAHFLTARDNYSKPKQKIADVQNEIIIMLVNSGQAVVLENIGKDKTISECTDNEVAKYSKYALATDAAEVGMTGCLVYHSLDSVTDLNNPYGAPADNTPDSFRTIATETGIIAELTDAYFDNREFSLDDIQKLLIDTIGYTAYSQDDEGATQSEDISTSDLNTFFTTLYEKSIDTTDELEAFRFHTGYNPSGGWEVNIAATSQSLPAECVDSDRDTTCGVDPIRFSFDGTTLTADDAGSYILEMFYVDSAFQDYGYVLNATSGKPYRDSNYQPVRVTINPDDYSAIDFTNPLYEASLDPMNDGNGNSAPFSNAAFKSIYPDMSNVDNAYLFGNPEIAARLMTLMNVNPKLEKLTAMEAYSLIKMITKALAGLPVSGGERHAILIDHGKTVSEWESLVTEWLKAASPSVRLEVIGKLQIKKGELSLESADCVLGGVSVKCSVDGLLTLNADAKTANESGTSYPLTGSFTISAEGFTKNDYSPTNLAISLDTTSGQLTGDTNLSLNFSGKDLVTKIDKGSTVNSTYSLTVFEP